MSTVNNARFLGNAITDEQLNGAEPLQFGDYWIINGVKYTCIGRSLGDEEDAVEHHTALIPTQQPMNQIPFADKHE